MNLAGRKGERSPRREADRLARVLRQVPDVKKIELVGAQDEKIYVEISHTRLSTLGIDPLVIFDALQKQNAMLAAGMFETNTDRVRLRVTGDLNSLESVRATLVQAGGKLFRLGDIATVTRGLVDPPTPRMHYQGQPAVGVAITMNKGGDVIKLGERLHSEVTRLQKDLPQGLDIHVVADQPGRPLGANHRSRGTADLRAIRVDPGAGPRPAGDRRSIR